MGEEIKGKNSRECSRIVRGFIVRFRAKESPEPEWEVSTIKDISEKGCCFQSVIPYKVGQVLDMRIQFPVLMVPMEFIGEVKRCESAGSKFPLYVIGVAFQGMDEEKKEEFVDMIAFFLRKQGGK
jgi:hypothetical protein